MWKINNEIYLIKFNISRLFCFIDYIVVGSDSGRIVILEYSPAKNIFEKVHQETFGKSGCRRIVPGQYLAIDPKGRAVMIGKFGTELREKFFIMMIIFIRVSADKYDYTLNLISQYSLLHIDMKLLLYIVLLFQVQLRSKN